MKKQIVSSECGLKVSIRRCLKMKKLILFTCFISLFGLIILIAACSSGSQPTADNPVQGKVVKTATVNKLTVTLCAAAC